MKVYLAGSWKRRAEIQGYAKQLQDLGIEVTSRWLLTQHGKLPRGIAAQEDVEDIDKARTLILFTDNPDSGYLTGGKHWETGYAFAKKKTIVLIGKPENVFHKLPGMAVFKSFEEFIDNLS